MPVGIMNACFLSEMYFILTYILEGYNISFHLFIRAGKEPFLENDSLFSYYILKRKHFF